MPVASRSSSSGIMRSSASFTLSAIAAGQPGPVPWTACPWQVSDRSKALVLLCSILPLGIHCRALRVSSWQRQRNNAAPSALSAAPEEGASSTSQRSDGGGSNIPSVWRRHCMARLVRTQAKRTGMEEPPPRPQTARGSRTMQWAPSPRIRGPAQPQLFAPTLYRLLSGSAAGSGVAEGTASAAPAKARPASAGSGLRTGRATVPASFRSSRLAERGDGAVIDFLQRTRGESESNDGG